MGDGHFARIFANFKDFPRELLVFEDFWGVRYNPGISRSVVQKIRLSPVKTDVFTSPRYSHKIQCDNQSMPCRQKKLEKFPKYITLGLPDLSQVS